MAAAAAARQTGVPLPVLRAIALAETGRKRGEAFRPWPWTINLAGKGLWFDSEASAQRFASARAAEGARRIDIGCFQLNYGWHGEGFASIAAMFDPRANALYAARFLRSLYDELGDWSRAAGAYHSRNPDLARPYRARFDRLLASLAPGGAASRLPPPAEAPPAGGSRVMAGARPLPMAAYPLLQPGGAADLGSLVAVGPAAGPSLIPLGDPEG